VLVATAGNSRNLDAYTQTPIPADSILPKWAADPNGLPNIIIVGASTHLGRAATFSQVGPGVTVYAPGDGVEGASTGVLMSRLYGTSFGMILSIPFCHCSTSSRHARGRCKPKSLTIRGGNPT
jgi:subtilisin family serine protease